MKKNSVHFLRLTIILTGLFFSQTGVPADTPIIHIEISNHLFIPSIITIAENTKVKLIIHNKDPSDEEFESYELNREKIIPAGHKCFIFIGPLAAGEYTFFGEFNPDTAQGKVIVK